MRRRLRLSLRTQRGVRRNGGAGRLLPDALDREVARLKLDSMGAGLEQLTEEQVRYLASWQEGT